MALREGEKGKENDKAPTISKIHYIRAGRGHNDMY
jgi:hypothetical protein